MEKYLRRDVVGIISYHTELSFTREHFVEIGLQEVAFEDTAFGSKLGIFGRQISHALPVDLGHFHVVAVGQKKLSEHTHAGAHLNHRHPLEVVKRRRYAPRHRQIGEKMLA